jgi:hypothetical protein
VAPPRATAGQPTPASARAPAAEPPPSSARGVVLAVLAIVGVALAVAWAWFRLR